MLLDSLSDKNREIAQQLDIDIPTAYACKIGTKYVLIEDTYLKSKISAGKRQMYSPVYVEARIPSLKHGKLKNQTIASIMYYLDGRDVLNVTTDTDLPVRDSRLLTKMLEYVETIGSIIGASAINLKRPEHLADHQAKLLTHGYEPSIVKVSGKSESIFFKSKPEIYNLRSDFEGLLTQATSGLAITSSPDEMA